MKCYPKLANLLQCYLLIVRPVEVELINAVKGPREYHIYMEYLWTKEGSAIKPKMMYNSINTFTTKYFGCSIGAQEYRQICVEIGRVFIGSEYELRLQELDVLASQAGHTIDTARSCYAPEEGHHARMSSDLLLRYGRVSEAWWEVIGLKPNTLPMLPLHVHQGLPQYNIMPLGQEQAAAGLAPQAPAIDSQAIILAVIAEFSDSQGWASGGHMHSSHTRTCRYTAWKCWPLDSCTTPNAISSYSKAFMHR